MSYSDSNISSTTFIGLEMHPAARVVFTYVCSLVLTCGVLGNGFLLLVLGSQRTLWQVHNIFIANLALADLVVVSSSMPYLFGDLVLGYHPVVNDVHCQVNGFFLCLSYSVSVISLVCISFNRYMKVCHSGLFSKLFSIKKNIGFCVGMWLLSCALNSPLLAGYPSYGYDKSAHMCQARAGKELNYGTLIMATHLVLPGFAIGYFNYAIFRYWRQSQARIQGKGKRNISTERDAAENIRKSKPNKSVHLSTIIFNRAAQSHAGLASNKSESSLTIGMSSCSNAGSTASLQKAAAAVNKPNKNRLTATEMALIRSLLVISICLLVLYTPFAICIVVEYFVLVPAEIVMIGALFLCTNCAINWIIYGAMNTSFRQAYVLTLSRFTVFLSQDESKEISVRSNPSKSDGSTVDILVTSETDNSSDVSYQ